jgi:hypothetical protein
MPKRKTARSTKQRAARQSQTRRSTRNAVSSQAMGELPYERDTLRNMDEITRYVRRINYSKMLEDTANFARQNMAATFGLSVAAGLVTTQLARRWSAILRKG